MYGDRRVYCICHRKIAIFIRFVCVFFFFSFENILSTGLVASQEEGTTRRNNFLHRKPNRNYRTKATQKTTRAPITDDDDEEIQTSPQCPEPDGFFADSEQCDKYYACRYGNRKVHLLYACVLAFFFFSLSLSWYRCCFNLLQWHCSQQTRFYQLDFYHTHFHILQNTAEYALHWIHILT